MIKKLTKEQEQRISEYRDRFFKMATSTEPGDYDKAGKAALRLAEIGGLKNCNVRIVATPEEGASLCDSLWASLSYPLWASLRDSIWDSLWTSLRASLWASLSDSLSDSLRDSIWDSLWTSLRASLCYSLSDSLRDSIRDSIWDSLWDSSWTAFYLYAVEEMGVACSSEHREILGLHSDTAKNCSAVWIAPGTVIICEKPTAVTAEDGRLVDIKWGEGVGDID